MALRAIVILLCALIGSVAAAHASTQDEVIVVQANVAQKEIERILDLDNLEVELLPPREVAAAMSAIPRGRAPHDFWIAYQAHVRAWQRYASATGSSLNSSSGLSRDDAARRAEARLAIDSTFDEVERIARGYGAKLPFPRRRHAASY